MKFTFSGIVGNSARFTEKIESLKGQVIPDFDLSCTHIVCFRFSATEKILSGLAAGLWIIKESYIEDSFKAKKWLPEEDYEVQNLAFLARHHRLRDSKLYERKTIYVCCKIPNYQSHERVIIAGGGSVTTKEAIKDKGESPEFAICDFKEDCDVFNVIGESKPVVSLSYFVETIFKRHNPNDLKPLTGLAFSKIKSKSDVTLKQEGGENSVENQVTPVKKEPLCTALKTPRRRNKVPFTPIKLEPTIQPSGDIQIIKEVRNIFPDSENDLTQVISSSSDSDIEIVDVVQAQSANVDTKLHATKDEEHMEINSTNETERMEINTIKGKEPVEISSPKGTEPVEISSPKEVENIGTSSTEEIKQSEDTKTKSFKEENPPKKAKISPQIPWQELSHEQKIDNMEYNVQQLNKYLGICMAVPPITGHYIMREFKARLYSSHSLLLKVDNTSYKFIAKNPRERAFDETSLYNNAIGISSYETITQKVGRYKKDFLVESKPVDDEFVMATMLECLKMSIITTAFPNSTVTGEMFKRQVLQEAPHGIKLKALRLFSTIVSMHPPSTTSLRTYYLNVFAHAAPNDTPGANKKWGFLKAVIEHSLCAVRREETCTHFLLLSIMPLFYQDLKFFKERPVSVKKLLTYRLFWEQEQQQKPSLMNKSVKEFIKIWVESAKYPIPLRDNIMNLFSIMVEVAWKYREPEDSLFLSKWPLSSYWMQMVTEISNQFNDFEDHLALIQMIDMCHVAWQRMLYKSVLLRAIDHSFKKTEITISNLRSFLEAGLKGCHDEDQDHILKMKLASSLVEDYLEAIGVPFFWECLLNKLRVSLQMNKDFVHYHPRDKTSKAKDPLNPAAKASSSSEDSSNKLSCTDQEEKEGELEGDTPEMDENSEEAKKITANINLIHKERKRALAIADKVKDRQFFCHHVKPLALSLK